MAAAAILKSQKKLRYLSNGLTDLQDEISYGDAQCVS